MPKKSYLTVSDHFCGAGGSSIGAVKAGAELKYAVNHWKLAVETHAANFPSAEHDCADLQAVSPRRYASTDLLITSPECTNHSLAKGKQRSRLDQPDLWGNLPDPGAVRSRMTMFSVPDYTEVHKYNAIVVENVVEATDWTLWPIWLQAMDVLGYAHQCVFLNSMFCWPTPQSRDRLYVVFWKKKNKAPDLDIRPKAWCPHCEKQVEGIQTWKNGRTTGKYRRQYIYTCPTCRHTVEPYYYPGYTAIDWSLPCPRIGDRPKPLKEKTLARIRAGLKKFSGQIMSIDMAFASGDRTTPITEAIKAQTTRQTMGLAIPPFTVSVNHSTDRIESTLEPTNTAMPEGNPALVMPPFMMDTIHNGRYGRHQDLVWSVYDPDRTQIAQGTKALIVPYYSTGTAVDTDQPVPTQPTVSRHALVTPPFVLGYYTRDSGQQAAITGIDEPIPTQSTQPRHYLVTPSEPPAVEDCGFRMIVSKEIQKIMAFPEDYDIHGNSREQVRQLGNAVTPPAMTTILERVIDTFR